MSKKQVINRKYINAQYPVGGTILTYLLYKNINPHGTLKGVLLTLFIAWWVLVWTAVIIQVFTTEASEPIFKKK